eukprot:2326115-Amphidinium_carterae.1
MRGVRHLEPNLLGHGSRSALAAEVSEEEVVMIAAIHDPLDDAEARLNPGKMDTCIRPSVGLNSTLKSEQRERDAEADWHKDLDDAEAHLNPGKTDTRIRSSVGLKSEQWERDAEADSDMFMGVAAGSNYDNAGHICF